MRIIIIGAGEVGSEIAAKLSGEQHDVIVIDKSDDALEKLANLDLITLKGNGASLDLLDSSDFKSTDLVIAVTQIDEINVMACLLAKKYGAKHTIARVRQTEYGNEYRSLTGEGLGIDVIINPELVAATEILKVVKNTSASETELFARGKVQMLGFRLTAESPLIDIPLRDLKFNSSLVAGVNRHNKHLIPTGNMTLEVGDHIYLIALTGQHPSYDWVTGKPRAKFEKIIVLGAGKVGKHTARILSKYHRTGVQVKLIDKDLVRCKEVALALPNVMVLHGNGTDVDFLLQEDIENTDAFIAVSGSDEVNILSALLAKKLGAKKTIVEINRPDYALLVDNLDIDTAIRPRLLTAARISKLVRRGGIISVTILGEDQAEIIELKADPKAPAIGRTLTDIEFPEGVLVGAIYRGENTIIPRGRDTIEADDHLVIIALKDRIDAATRMFLG